MNPYRPTEITREEIAARQAKRPVSAEDADVRMAAAELGVTPQLLANVLNRRRLHLGADPAALRKLELSRDTLEVASVALRRRAKVHTLDDGVSEGLNKLATFLDLEPRP